MVRVNADLRVRVCACVRAAIERAGACVRVRVCARNDDARMRKTICRLDIERKDIHAC